MKLFRRVSKAEAKRTLKNGFEDYVDTFSRTREFSGVWVSDNPVDCLNFENTATDVLLEIDLAVSEYAISGFERMEKGKWYREWVLPAQLLNAHAKVRVIDEGDTPPLTTP